jgi:hypothetical protein
MAGRGAGRGRRLLVLAALGALALAGAVAGVVLLTGRDATDEEAACTVEDYPAEDVGHAGGTLRESETFPLTSGSAAAEPLPWGRYERPVDQRRAVHNLYHGGVVVQYGPEVSAATAQRIRAWYQSDPDGLVLAPLTGLGGRVALTAWGELGMCRVFDEPAFSSFRDRFRFMGPERIAREAMRPGVGGAPVGLLEGLTLTPRPFVRTLTIAVSLGKDAVLNVEVEDDRGRIVRVLGPAALQTAGPVRMTWDRRDDRGRIVPAGAYVVRVEAATGSETATASASAEAGRL